MKLSPMPVLRQIRARPRLALSFLAGLVCYLVLPEAIAMRTATRFLASWNGAVVLYLALSAHMAWGSTPAQLSRRAQLQDEGQGLVLLLSVAASLVSLLAIVDELSVVKDMSGSLRFWHIALSASTVAISWLFMHLMFALHYAHDYYLNLARGRDGGLSFPGAGMPDYWDFLYFAAVIGTSGQTADVSFSGRTTRRIGLAHCVVAFFYNTTVVALSINIAASVI
ncbi:MAG: hypothetical protein RJA36_1242 [Pseudomonadota bacterium]